VSILGVVVRVRRTDLDVTRARLGEAAGVELALDPDDGRLILLVEDVLVEDGVRGAAETLARIAGWPEVLNTSLVYEYSGPDAPPAGGDATAGLDYRAWRGLGRDGWRADGERGKAGDHARRSITHPDTEKKEPQAWN
jgi:nitrate reductase NapAB chaperone NapD